MYNKLDIDMRRCVTMLQLSNISAKSWRQVILRYDGVDFWFSLEQLPILYLYISNRQTYWTILTQDQDSEPTNIWPCS